MSVNNGTSDLPTPTNSSSNGSDSPLTIGGLGEVKEALGRLYKKVNELEISQKAEREQDRAELKAWAQTNLIQTQLLNKQTDSSYRAADSRAEDQGELLAAVRAEQRELAERITALEESVADYAQILATNREIRAERAKSRSRGVEDNLGGSLDPDELNQPADKLNTHHAEIGTDSINRGDSQTNARKRGRGLAL